MGGGVQNEDMLVSSSMWNVGVQGPSEVTQRQQQSEWRCMNEGNLRQSVASKASTRYDGAEEDEDCQLRSHTVTFTAAIQGTC